MRLFRGRGRVDEERVEARGGGHRGRRARGRGRGERRGGRRRASPVPFFFRIFVQQLRLLERERPRDDGPDAPPESLRHAVGRDERLELTQNARPLASSSFTRRCNPCTPLGLERRVADLGAQRRRHARRRAGDAPQLARRRARAIDHIWRRNKGEYRCERVCVQFCNTRQTPNRQARNETLRTATQTPTSPSAAHFRVCKGK